MRSITTCEIVQVQLAKSFCLPLLTYLVCALDIIQCKVCELGVCWNYGLNRLESVKLIQYFCGALDFKHYYDIQRWRFVSNVGTKVAYLSRFFVARELENHVCIYLEHSYRVSDGESVSSAVYN